MGQPDKERHLPDGVILNNRYKIIRFLSAGGFGNTYEAEDIEEGSHVAVKELFISGTCKRDDDSRGVTISVAENRMLFSKQKDKFRKEANRLRSIHHPNVVRVRDEFEANGTAYYVMDFVRGKSLADMLREGALNEKKSVQYIKQVLSALEAVHNAGILHLDIKPGNVMVDDNNSVVLIDFGASKQLEMVDGKSLSLSTGIAFTPGFAAIEQMTGNNEIIGKYTDIYSIGATLYKLITGVTPPNPNEILIEGLPEISASPQVQSAIKSAMQVKYTERPQSVAELRSILNGDAIAKEPLQPPIASRQQEQDDKTIVDTDNISNKAPSPDEDKTNVAEENKPKVRLEETSSESETKPDTASKSGSKRSLIPVLVTLGLIFLGVLIYFGVRGNFGSSSNDSTADTSAYNYIEDAPAVPPVEVVEEETAQQPTQPVEISGSPAVTVADETAQQAVALEQQYQSDYSTAEWLYNQKKYSECKIRCQSMLNSYPSHRSEINALISKCDSALSAQQASEQASTSSRLPDKAVDLGLSVLWADRNVGASSPSDYGGYYAWGETSTKSDYDWDTYTHCDGSYNTCHNIGSNIAGTRYDVARQKWGGGWKMPTKSQWEELLNRCTWTWTTQSGHNGYKVTGPNGNSIFLPAVGYRFGTSSRYVGSRGAYCSSTLSESYANLVNILDIYSSGHRCMNCASRNDGFAVRPVCNK